MERGYFFSVLVFSPLSTELHCKLSSHFHVFLTVCRYTKVLSQTEPDSEVREVKREVEQEEIAGDTVQPEVRD